MSILAKVPYINLIISGLSPEAKESFLELLDTPISNFTEVGFTKEDVKISSLSDGIHGIALHTGYEHAIRYGYLIKGSTLVFLCFSDTNNRNDIINIYEINDTKLIKVEESLDAAELRNLLVDAEQGGGGGDAGIHVITVGLTQIVKAGQDVSSGHAYLTLSTTAEQQAILENLNNGIIKIDLSAVQSTLQLPVAYIWIKKNTINVLQGKTLIQYSFDNSGFEYGHALDDNYIVLKEIGTGGAIYESTTTKELFISFSSINPTIMWTRIGDCEKVIPEEASESNKLADKAWVSSHSGGGTQLYKHVWTMQVGTITYMSSNNLADTVSQNTLVSLMKNGIHCILESSTMKAVAPLSFATVLNELYVLAINNTGSFQVLRLSDFAITGTDAVTEL